MTTDTSSPYAPPQAQLADTDDYRHIGEVVYAGFWKRFAALVIDAFVITIAYYAIVLVVSLAFGIGAGAGVFSGGLRSGDSMPLSFIVLLAVIYLAYPIISGLYFIGFESSSKQATLGKMAVGIKVTDADGRRIGRGRALGRWASHLLCYLSLFIGYILAGFTQRKRGLHDMVAGTLVVDRWAYSGHPERQRRELGAVTISMIVLGLLATLGYLAIMLAIAIPAYQSYLQRVAAGA